MKQLQKLASDMRLIGYKLDRERFAGMDQNPGGIRDLVSSSAIKMGRLADQLEAASKMGAPVAREENSCKKPQYGSWGHMVGISLLREALHAMESGDETDVLSAFLEAAACIDTTDETGTRDDFFMLCLIKLGHDRELYTVKEKD